MNIEKICGFVSSDFERYSCYDGASLFLLSRCDKSVFEDLCRNIQDNGFTLYTSSEDEANASAIYTRFGETATITFEKRRSCLRLISEKCENLPPKKTDDGYKCVTTTLVTQLKLSYLVMDCGMSYLIRLSDGRFVMIDGGYSEYEEPQELFRIMNEQNVLDDIKIAAWFITHPHDDHYRCFVSFMKLYSENVTLERLVFNFPKRDITKGYSDTCDDGFDTLAEGLGKEKVITAHTCQSYNFADAVFDILFTCDDLYPENIPNINDSSMVIRMTVGERRVLWLGDAQKQCSEYLCSRYGKSSLQCEFMQVAHHGYWGGSSQLYRLIDPEVLLWPCPDFQFQRLKSWDANATVLASEKVKEVLFGDRESYTIDLSKPVCDSNPKKDTEKSDIFYHSELKSVKRVIDLKITCLTCGGFGYDAPKISLTENGCLFKASEKAYSVIELLKPSQLSGIDSYKARLCGSAEASDNGNFGIIFNYETPTVWDKEKVFWLDGVCGEFDITLSVGEGKNKVYLYSHGEKVWEENYTPVGSHGLYIVLRNAAVEFSEIEVVK